MTLACFAIVVAGCKKAPPAEGADAQQGIVPTNVRAEVVTLSLAPQMGKKIVRVKFDTHFASKLDDGKFFAVHVACNVGGRRLDGTGGWSAFGEKSPSVQSEDTKLNVEAAFANDALAEAPQNCDIEFGTSNANGQDAHVTQSYCFTPPTQMTSGRCAP